MSAKTIAVLDEADLKDGEMKQVEFEKDGKVLVYRLGDKVHATSAFCTHYGAPLAKGVLTGDGRIVCPWHGACFNVCTGDIEDAPAPSAIHSFKAHVADGKIHVTANPSQTLKDNMSRAPKLSSAGERAGAKGGVVIVGGGSGTFHCVESLRENGYTGGITILTREKYPPIDRTKLSKALVTDPSKIEWRTAADLKIKYGTNLRTGVMVTSINSSKKSVTLDSGKETISYDTLVLAPGGTPRRLPIDGANLENVFTLRDIDDAKKIDAAAQEGKNMVVIGSSFISMELVVAVCKRKLASINVIGMEEFPFELVLGKEIGKSLMKYHESQGVRFHMRSSVEKIIASSDVNSKVATGIAVNGQTLPADLVVMGVGVAPATEFLKDSGIQLEKDGGVKVDQYLKVGGVDNIYAIGDIAHFPQINGEHKRIEHWNVAGNHGRAIGRTIAGKEPIPFQKVPVFWSAQGQQLRYCGMGSGYDDIIIRGNPDEMKFIAYYLKAEKVVAVATMQNDPVVSKASELLRIGAMPSADELRNGKSILDVDISTSAARLT